ncbi:MAG: hypothetical protein N4A62_20505 [Marinisporobacter sp.]|jgi:hypothetical protein|nr:hypothetical protein [Marinisporobacter sp.]
MQSKFIGSSYQIIHILNDTKEYQTVLCQDISNKNITHQFILNIYKDKKLIQKFAPLLSKLNRDICHNFVELFVENSYLVSVFIYHEYIPLKNYLASNDLTLKAQLELGESLLLELLKNDNIKDSLKYFAFNPSNIVVDDHNKAHINFILIPDVCESNHVDHNITNIIKLLFKDKNTVPKDLKSFLDKLQNHEYSLISSIYADYKRILDKLYAQFDIEKKDDFSTKIKRSILEKFKNNTRLSNHLFTLRVTTILLVLILISTGSWYAYNHYFSTLINTSKPTLTESVIIDDRTQVNLSIPSE